MSRYSPSREMRVIGRIGVPKAPAWMEDAACLRVGHEKFFGPASDEGDETEEEKEAREDRARETCDGCPVRAQCKQYATGFSNGLQVGVWHGGNDDQRKLDHRKELRRAAEKRRRERQAS
ncbi:WhiB family transcriptional regulator [Nonomuraea basaltis]|uniref:WhiB family transcriptional regulator n=1 Tax=Nonomuraea basaltis TaxID=2495887 RepID=UPI00110C55E0|nr:WhiB family transcriptional regulator [Nonomuraea basaltis]TMR90538.1 WhiB family transcriptional regulator [Nonomuraea basaltis]